MARHGVLLAAALLFQANPCAALLCYVSTRMPIAAADAREGIDETISGINARPRKPMRIMGSMAGRRSRTSSNFPALMRALTAAMALQSWQAGMVVRLMIRRRSRPELS
jgi:hypothetical protein